MSYNVMLAFLYTVHTFSTYLDWQPIFLYYLSFLISGCLLFGDLPLIKKPLHPQGSSTITENMSLQRHCIFTFPVRYFCWCICGRALHWGVWEPLQHFSTPSDNERNFTQWIHFSLWSQQGEIASRVEREKTGCWVKRGANTRRKKERRGNDCESREEWLPVDWIRKDASFNNCKTHKDGV